MRERHKIQGEDDRPLQQSHDEGAQTPGKPRPTIAELSELRSHGKTPHLVLSPQGARRIVPEWNDLDAEARRVTERILGMELETLEAPPAPVPAPPPQPESPIGDATKDPETLAEL